MATRPDITLARWADTGSAYVVDPASGSRNTGFVGGDPADEGIVNALMLQAYRWFQFLNDLHSDIGDRIGTLWLVGSDATPNSSSATITRLGGVWRSVTSGGAQSVLFPIRFPAGTRITSITVYGIAGNTAGETFAATFLEVDAYGSVVNTISSTKTSGTTGGQESIGWTTADTEFTPSGYVMTSNPHYVEVALAQTSVAAEVQVSAIKIVVG
jgi:hypothetical protein